MNQHATTAKAGGASSLSVPPAAVAKLRNRAANAREAVRRIAAREAEMRARGNMIGALLAERDRVQAEVEASWLAHTVSMIQEN